MCESARIGQIVIEGQRIEVDSLVMRDSVFRIAASTRSASLPAGTVSYWLLGRDGRRIYSGRLELPQPVIEGDLFEVELKLLPTLIRGA